jgi:hypothetical protein
MGWLLLAGALHAASCLHQTELVRETPQTRDPLRRQIGALQLRRRSAESKLLQPRILLSASLIERYLGSGSQRRSTPAYYLSDSKQGRSKLTYVKKEALAAVREQCDAREPVEHDIVEGRPFRVFVAKPGRLGGMLDFLLKRDCGAPRPRFAPRG